VSIFKFLFSIDHIPNHLNKQSEFIS